MSKVDESRDDYISAEELDDVLKAAKAHAKKWNRTDAQTCMVFVEFVRQVTRQPPTN